MKIQWMLPTQLHATSRLIRDMCLDFDFVNKLIFILWPDMAR